MSIGNWPIASPCVGPGPVRAQECDPRPAGDVRQPPAAPARGGAAPLQPQARCLTGQSPAADARQRDDKQAQQPAIAAPDSRAEATLGAEDRQMAARQAAATQRLREQFDELFPGDPRRIDAAVADTLRCLDGRKLDLSRLRGDLAPAVQVTKVWNALQDCAAADGSGGIDTVLLPQADGQTIDLRGLNHLRAVTCGGRPKVLRVCVGVTASAARPAAGEPAPRAKTSVEYYEDGQCVDRSALAGAIYFHGKRGESEVVELNGRARFDDDKLFDPMIWCRHLAPAWHEDRQAHLRQKAADRAAAGDSKESKESEEAPSDSLYRHYDTQDAIRRHVNPAVDFDAFVAEARAEAVFDTGEFGSQLADAFARMKPGDRWFLASEGHPFPVELQVKDKAALQRREYVVNFYDPNFTNTHLRTMVLSPDDLRGRPLSEWLNPQHLELHFGSNPRAGLYRLNPTELPVKPQPSASRAAAAAAQDGKASPSHASLYWALIEGSAGEVETLMGRLLRPPEGGPGLPLQELLSRVFPGLTRAMLFGRSDTAAAYARCVLRSDLPHADKLAMLEGVAETGRHASALQQAFRVGSDEALRQFMEELVTAPDGKALQPADWTRLLQGDEGEPLLHHFGATSKTWRSDPHIREKRDRAIFYTVSAIVRSDLPLDEKRRLCAASHGGATAAQAAVRAGHPAAAAAMICAILQMDGPTDERRALLEALGVDPAEVVRQLRIRGRKELPWLAHISRSKNDAGLDKSVKAAAVAAINELQAQSLAQALADGKADLIGAKLDGALRAVGFQRLPSLIDTALNTSVEKGGSDVVEAYACSVLNRPDLSSADRHRLLKLESWRHAPPLQAALMGGKDKVVGVLAREIAGADDKTLRAGHRLDLLNGPAWNDSQGDHQRVPLLHRACTERAVSQLQRSERDKAIFEGVRAIVQSKRLSLKQKLELCCSTHKGKTAAQAAIAAGNPGAAAAMVCAIQQIGDGPDAAEQEKRLVEGLKVDLPSLKQQLDRRAKARWSFRVWQ